jgi:hypothetical protein
MTTPLHKVLENMESFDLICLTRNSFNSIVSYQVQKKIYNDNDDVWPHVGIIIKNDVLPTIENKIYFWHASASGGGIEMCDFEKYIYLENSKIIKIGWCKLKNNPLHRNTNDTDESYNKRIKKIKKQINDFYIHTKNSTFTYFMPYLSVNFLPFLKNIFHKKNKTDKEEKIVIKKKYFCSNYVTTIYQIIGVVDKSENPDTFFPETFIRYNNKNGPIFNKPVLLNFI